MRTSNDPRHIIRVKTMQELFAWGFSEDQSVSESQRVRESKSRIQTIIQNLEKIDKLIEEAAPERPLKQINPIDLSVLRQAIYELVIEPKAPVKVVVDEAVELGKEFGSDSSASFINGALGKIILEQKIEDGG